MRPALVYSSPPRMSFDLVECDVLSATSLNSTALFSIYPRCMERICQNPVCGAVFDAPEKEVRRGNARFCSLSCAATVNAKERYASRPKVPCAFCFVEFYPRGNRKPKHGLFFCCRAHKDAAQRLGGISAIQPSHYGTGTEVRSYRTTAFRSYPPRCNRCDFDRYQQILVVHHRDRDRSNNTVENLEILCPNCHAIEHYVVEQGELESPASSLQD